MTRLQIMSDVHVEFHADRGRSFVDSLDPTGVDVLIVAGDLGVGDALFQTLIALCEKYAHVVYVTGNHEYYWTSWGALENRLGTLAAKTPNLYWLNDSMATIGGQRFVGGTLWFDRDVVGDRYKHDVSDFNVILNFEPEVYERNRHTVDFLNRTVGSTDVVITHHPPSPRSIHPKYAGSPINAYFCHDMSRLIAEAKPRLWVHGHSHSSSWYTLGNTEIICNPFGYVGVELNRDYVQRFVIDI